MPDTLAQPVPVAASEDAVPFRSRLKDYLPPVDGRYEDLRKGNRKLNIFRDFAAGLIVAVVAIPLAMGFAMASGLRPEQGIIGALFGGSKYQVYGPTAGPSANSNLGSFVARICTFVFM